MSAVVFFGRDRLNFELKKKCYFKSYQEQCRRSKSRNFEKRKCKMGYNQFKKDLETKGKPCEQEVLKIIQKWDSGAYIEPGLHPEFDIHAPTIDRTFEVKNDTESIKTSNVFIETKIKNDKGTHKSGIKITLADTFVIRCYFIGEWYLMFIPTDALWSLVQSKREYHKKIDDQVVYYRLLDVFTLEKFAKYKEKSTLQWEI